MTSVKTFFSNYVDGKLVGSTIAAGVILGVGIYGLRKAGLGKVANVVKGGK